MEEGLGNSHRRHRSRMTPAAAAVPSPSPSPSPSRLTPTRTPSRPKPMRSRPKPMRSPATLCAQATREASEVARGESECVTPVRRQSAGVVPEEEEVLGGPAGRDGYGDNGHGHGHGHEDEDEASGTSQWPTPAKVEQPRSFMPAKQPRSQPKASGISSAPPRQRCAYLRVEPAQLWT